MGSGESFPDIYEVRHNFVTGTIPIMQCLSPKLTPSSVVEDLTHAKHSSWILAIRNACSSSPYTILEQTLKHVYCDLVSGLVLDWVAQHLRIALGASITGISEKGAVADPPSMMPCRSSVDLRQLGLLWRHCCLIQKPSLLEKPRLFSIRLSLTRIIANQCDHRA